MTDWHIYHGGRDPHDGIGELPPPPDWRTFPSDPDHESDPAATRRLGDLARAATYLPSDDEVELVNAALYLRRPLLLTGKPGTGKSTLAYSVARELKLGPVLKWPVTSRSTRQEGLYQYDALARLQDSSRGEGTDIGRYIRLGPLGTALLPSGVPRVLLIDELDKSDIDLPNDLLTIFEDGEYEITELSRRAREEADATVRVHDGSVEVAIKDGRVRCSAFPLVIITSNDERYFPPAFLRRCLRLRIDPPRPDRLEKIVRAHLDFADGGASETEIEDLIRRFVERRDRGDLATDQLLNAIYLNFNHVWPGNKDRLVDTIFQYLNNASV